MASKKELAERCLEEAWSELGDDLLLATNLFLRYAAVPLGSLNVRWTDPEERYRETETKTSRFWEVELRHGRRRMGTIEVGLAADVRFAEILGGMEATFPHRELGISVIQLPGRKCPLSANNLAHYRGHIRSWPFVRPVKFLFREFKEHIRTKDWAPRPPEMGGREPEMSKKELAERCLEDAWSELAPDLLAGFERFLEYSWANWSTFGVTWNAPQEMAEQDEAHSIKAWEVRIKHGRRELARVLMGLSVDLWTAQMQGGMAVEFRFRKSSSRELQRFPMLPCPLTAEDIRNYRELIGDIDIWTPAAWVFGEFLRQIGTKGWAPGG